MYRLFTLVAVGFMCFASSSASPLPLPADSSNVEDLYLKIQDLETRMSNIHVQCVDKQTNFDAAAGRPIVYLDRQNVVCPDPYTLSRFQLDREREGRLSDDDRVRYIYRCCKVVL